MPTTTHLQLVASDRFKLDRCCQIGSMGLDVLSVQSQSAFLRGVRTSLSICAHQNLDFSRLENYPLEYHPLGSCTFFGNKIMREIDVQLIHLVK